MNGHSSIVSLLCEHGADIKAKNDEHVTPFEISCQKGYFEISKTLIEHYETGENLSNSEDCPLHTACYEGAHEVVRVLLQKGNLNDFTSLRLLVKISNCIFLLLNLGAIIDRLNSDNENCLDVSIARGHREVIRVLLNDPNWKKLIRVNNYDVHVNEDENLSSSNLAANSLTIHSDHQSSVIDAKNVPHKVIECKSFQKVDS